MDRMAEVEERVDAVVADQAENFDLDRMRALSKRETQFTYLELLSLSYQQHLAPCSFFFTVVSKKEASLAGIESSVLNFVKSGARRFFVYGDRNSTSASASDNWSDFLLDNYDHFLDLPADYWTGLMRTFLAGKGRVLIKAIPSKKQK